jgi:hypothetical protein
MLSLTANFRVGDCVDGSEDGSTVFLVGKRNGRTGLVASGARVWEG